MKTTTSCARLAPLHQHSDGTIHAREREVTHTITLGDVASCTCPVGQRCHHLEAALTQFAAFYSFPSLGVAQGTSLFEQIRSKLSIVPAAVPALCETEATPAAAPSAPSVHSVPGSPALPVCTENPPCVRLEMTPAIAAALALLAADPRSNRPAA